MFKYKTIKEVLIEERNRTAAMQSSLLKTVADLEYIAMMTDVELDETEETDDGNE